MPTHSSTPPVTDTTAVALQRSSNTISTADAIYEAIFDRSFNFRIQLPYETALSFIRRIDHYNEFNWSTVTDALERIDGLIPRSQYKQGNPNNGKRDYKISVGREGSPVIYLERLEFFNTSWLDTPTMKAICREMELIASADESHYHIEDSVFLPGRKVEFRFWWD